jgi:cytoskeletal protein CcmA (bactofilin family)
MAQSDGFTVKRDDGIPILIPDESILEGFIKTRKSFKIESIFYGTLLSTQKVIIDANSVVKGDIICSELIIGGSFEGNIFCTGKVEVHGNAKITGMIYTKLFQNEDSCNLNCVVQVPNNEVFHGIRELLMKVDSTTKLSADVTLGKITSLFMKNVYSFKQSEAGNKNATISFPIDMDFIEPEPVEPEPIEPEQDEPEKETKPETKE